MSATQRRISIAAIAVICANIRILMTLNFIFSGDAVRYARFLHTEILGWLVTGAFASLALVLSVPVLWQGTWRQIVFAIVLILIAALVLVITYEGLA